VIVGTVLVGVVALGACSDGSGDDASRQRASSSTTSTAPLQQLAPPPVADPSQPASVAPASTDSGQGFDFQPEIGPQPTVPPAGCPPQSGDVVTIVLADLPQPSCVTAAGAQALRIENTNATEVLFALDGIQETIGPNDSMTIGPLGEQLEVGRHIFWSPDHPGLMGIIDVA
jgi:hypothetical protein